MGSDAQPPVRGQTTINAPSFPEDPGEPDPPSPACHENKPASFCNNLGGSSSRWPVEDLIGTAGGIGTKGGRLPRFRWRVSGSDRFAAPVPLYSRRKPQSLLATTGHERLNPRASGMERYRCREKQLDGMAPFFSRRCFFLDLLIKSDPLPLGISRGGWMLI